MELEKRIKDLERLVDLLSKHESQIITILEKATERLEKLELR